MCSVNRSAIDRLSGEIAALRKADAAEAKKEADLLGKGVSPGKGVKTAVDRALDPAFLGIEQLVSESGARR